MTPHTCTLTLPADDPWRQGSEDTAIDSGGRGGGVTPTTETTSQGKTSGISGGAIAGIATGAVFAVAVACLAGLWVIHRRGACDTCDPPPPPPKSVAYSVSKSGKETPSSGTGVSIQLVPCLRQVPETFCADTLH